MDVAIAGAHGQIAQLLTRLLLDGGDSVTGLIRDPAQSEDIRAAGAAAVVCDLEKASVEEIAEAITGADAVVFAAGAGPGSGGERKLTMDRDGAIKLLQAASAVGARRYVIISSSGAEDPPTGDDVFEIYLRAKAEADAAVRASDRDWTIVRPGRLTEDPGTASVRIETAPLRGSIPREDVAAVIARLLGDPRANGHLLYVNSGDLGLDDALDRALGDQP